MNEITFDKSNIELKPAVVKYDLTDIRNQVMEVVEKYDGLIYTDDDIPEAKKVTAWINKLSKSLNDTRISVEKEYIIPFTPFKDEVKELKTLLDGTSKNIKAQVNEFEEQQKQIKRDHIEKLFINELEKFEFDINLEMIFDSKWLNKSVSDNAIVSAIQNELMGIENDLKSIKLLNSPHYEVLVKTYFKDLNLVTTLELNQTLLETVAEPEITNEPINPIERKDGDEILNYMLQLKCTKEELEYIVDVLKNMGIKHLVS